MVSGTTASLNYPGPLGFSLMRIPTKAFSDSPRNWAVEFVGRERFLISCAKKRMSKWLNREKEPLEDVF
jgi:hypothetical protein